jgi:hypothetical protein
LTGLLLPGTSYLFTWPLFFALLGFGYLLHAREQETTKTTLALAAFALPGLLLLAPAVHLIFVALTISLPGVAAVLIVLLLGLLTPLLCRMAGLNKWLVPAAAALLGLGFILLAGWTSGTSATRPRPDNLFYCLNAETGEAWWTSVDERPDEWTSNFFPAGTERGKLTECLPQSSRTFLKSKAPVAPLAAPRVELIADQKNNEIRTLQLRLTSARDANAISIFFDRDAELIKASISDQPVLSRNGNEPKQGWFVYYYAPPPEGVVLTLETRSANPLSARVVDLSYGLPVFANPALKRPDYLVPSMYFVSDATLVCKSFRF